MVEKWVRTTTTTNSSVDPQTLITLSQELLKACFAPIACYFTRRKAVYQKSTSTVASASTTAMYYYTIVLLFQN